MADKEITPSDLWQPGFNDLWNEIAPFVVGPNARGYEPPCRYDEIFMRGGRSSGKSYTAAIWIMMALTNDSKKNAVVVRKVGSSIRKSCFQQMQKAIRKLRIEAYWKINKTDMVISNPITEQQIVFVGLDDEEKVRSITTKTGYFSVIWFEEAKQFSNYEELLQARASILRGGGDDESEDKRQDEDYAAEFMTFITYNPPRSSLEWINGEAQRRKEGRIVHKSSYLTMPPKWVGKNILLEAERLKREDPKMYRYMYLGEIIGTAGTYFSNVEERRMSDEDIAKFDYFDMGCDWGLRDPNVFLKVYLDEDKRELWIFDEIYQREEDASSDSMKIYEFAEMVKEHMKDCPDDPVWCDCQGTSEIAILNSDDYNIDAHPVPKHFDNGRDKGYNYLQKLRKIYIDPVRCPNALREFSMFESLALPNGQGWADKPGKKNDHVPDCCRYAIWQQIKYEDVEE